MEMTPRCVSRRASLRRERGRASRTDPPSSLERQETAPRIAARRSRQRASGSAEACSGSGTGDAWQLDALSWS
eukprot:839113-Pleurochrysis_carterae.AAC.1